MLSFYKCFHQTIKYGHQKTVLQDLTGLEIEISMKTNNRKPVCQKLVLTFLDGSTCEL